MDARPDLPLLVVTDDAALLERVLAVTATLDVPHQVLLDPAALRAAWPRAAVVLVGLDQAARLAGLALPPRRRVVLVGADDQVGEVCAWSAPLDAAALTLPAGADALAETLDLDRGRRGGGRLVGVLGGAGGTGSSTLAAGLAVTAARLGRRPLLVDLDEHGGGLDLLVGAERSAGWRWSRLAAARGFLGDLRGQLPQADGVDVLAAARETGGPLTGEAVRAVLLSAARSHDLVVVDLPRAQTAAVGEALRQLDEVLVVVRADLRGIAAAREIAREVRPSCRSLSVVVREGRVRGVDAEAVADALELPCVAVVAHQEDLVLAAERGDPPGRATRSALARCCRLVLDQLGLQGAAA